MSERPQGTALLDHLQGGVLLVEGGRITFASARAPEILGSSRRQLENAYLEEVLPPGASEVLLRVEAGASSCTFRDLPWERANGRDLTITGTPGPKPGQVLLLISPAEEPAERSDREAFRKRLAWLDSLAAGVAHEVRNPLGGIRGAAQLIRRGAEPEERDELCALIIRESDRIDAQVERLMVLTRPRPLRREAVDINSIALEQVALLTAEHGRRLEWELDLDPSLPVTEGDELRLSEAIGNLLRNAAEAARSVVHVRSRVDPEGRLREQGLDRGLALRMDIRDDGPGIDPGSLPGLFAPFATTKPNGDGLGLFVTRRALEDHGGYLSVESSPEDGACFSLLLRERISSEATP